MSLYIESLVTLARYSWVRLKRHFIMSSNDSTAPFQKLLTPCRSLDAYSIDFSLEEADISKLEVRNIEFKKKGSMSRHEYCVFAINYEGNNIAYGTIERTWGRPPEPAKIDLSSPPSMGQSGVLVASSSGSDYYPAVDTIHVERDKALVDIQSIKAPCMGTFTTTSSALEFSYAKLVVIGASILEAVPAYRLLSTNCYYFVALVLDMAKNPGILGGHFVESDKSRMGEHTLFKIVDTVEAAFNNDLIAATQVFSRRWEAFLNTHEKTFGVAQALAKKDEIIAKSRATHKSEMLKKEAEHKGEMSKKEAEHKGEMSKKEAEHKGEMSKKEAEYKGKMLKKEAEYKEEMLKKEVEYENERQKFLEEIAMLRGQNAGPSRDPTLGNSI